MTLMTEVSLPTQRTPILSWRKATGRALLSGGNLLHGTTTKGALALPLPLQRIVAADVRVRSSKETSVPQNISLYVQDVLTQALLHLGLVAELRVLLRPDGTGRSLDGLEQVSAVAALRGLFEALEEPLPLTLVAQLCGTSLLTSNKLAWCQGEALEEPVRYPHFALSVIVPRRTITPRQAFALPNVNELEAEMRRALDSEEDVIAANVARVASLSADLQDDLSPHPLYATLRRSEHLLETPPLGYAVSAEQFAISLLYPDTVAGRQASYKAGSVLARIIADSDTWQIGASRSVR